MYLQETSSQLDSISGTADTTQVSQGQKTELRLSNKLNQYLDCEGTLKYFEGPFDAVVKIQQLVARGELLSALIGADSLSTKTYSVTKYSSFLPRLTLHVYGVQSNGQEINVNLTNCLVSSATITFDINQIVMNDVEIVGESLGTINWKVS